MARYNLDNHLKERLEKRRLQPSQEAWDKLSDRLDGHTKKTTANRFWWLGLAASIIGIVFFVVLQDRKEGPTANTVVETPKTPTEAENIIPQPEILLEQPIEIAGQTEEPVIQSPSVPEAKTQNNQQWTEIDEGKLEAPDQNIRETVVVEKPTDIAAQDPQRNGPAEILVDAEVDALLKAAENTLFKERLRREGTPTVDADALLLEVEEQLPQSLRTRVFKTLKSSYETVVTVVSDRHR